MSLLFNALSWSVIALLPRSNRLLILWLQSVSAVILTSEPGMCFTELKSKPKIFTNPLKEKNKTLQQP